MSVRNYNPFLPSSRVFIQKDLVKNEDLFFLTLNRFYDSVVDGINARVLGAYASGESLATGKEIYLRETDSKVNVLRTLLEFSGISLGTSSFPSEITPSVGGKTLIISKLYGMARSGDISLPIPYIDPLDLSNCIGISMNGANLQIVTNTAGWNDFNFFIVIEYGYS